MSREQRAGREQKAVVIDSLRSSFADSNASFLVNYRGLTVEQLQDLRKGLRANGAHMKIAKARLMKRAADEMPAVAELLPYFKEQIGIVFTHEQSAPAVAKTLTEFAKRNEIFSVVVGSLEQQLLNQQDVARIASLPSKEVLLAMLCGTLKAPIASLARVLAMTKTKLEQAG